MSMDSIIEVLLLLLLL